MPKTFFATLNEILKNYTDARISPEIAMEAIRRLVPVGVYESETEERCRQDGTCDEETALELESVEAVRLARVADTCESILEFPRANGRR